MAPIQPTDGGGGSIDVTPDDVNSAAQTFAKQEDQLGNVWSTLASSLRGPAWPATTAGRRSSPASTTRPQREE